MAQTSATVRRTYYILTAGNTLAASLIWGINTIFLLDAGLSNFEAFAANAFVMSAVHLHLIGLLGALGPGASAALIGALIGLEAMFQSTKTRPEATATTVATMMSRTRQREDGRRGAAAGAVRAADPVVFWVICLLLLSGRSPVPSAR